MATCHSLTAAGARASRPSEDGRARTQRARETFRERFETLVDPDGVLDPATRTARADEARRNWMRLLARRSTQVRQAARQARIARQQAEQLDAAQRRCDHLWPDELTSTAECEVCGLAYGDWMVDGGAA